MNFDGAPMMSLWIAKLAGAAAGSAISVAYLLPRGRREAAVRFVIGLTTGIVFGGPAGLVLADRVGLAGQMSPEELLMMGSAAASLCAWWALGILSRLAGGIEKLPIPLPLVAPAPGRTGEADRRAREKETGE